METEVYGIMLMPVVLGGVEILKGLGLPRKFCPLAALCIGILMGIVYLSTGDIKEGILKGAYLGLSAVGIYSGAKNMMQNKNK